MDVKVIDLLRTYSLPSLQQMARQRGLDPKQKTKKEPMVQALVPVMIDRKAIQASLDDLAEGERLLLDRIILAGGDTVTELIRRQLEREGRIDRTVRPDRGYSYGFYGQQEKGSARNRGSRKFEDVVARVGALGLVFTTEPVHSSGSIVELNQPGRRLVVPRAILRQLPPVELSLETAPPPATVHEADPAPLLRDLYLLLSFAAREPIPLTARGLIVKRSLTRIDGTLRNSEVTAGIRSEDDLAWLPFLRALAEELGLLVASAGELLPGTKVESFLRRPASERQQLMFEAWRQATRWNELFRIPALSVRGKGMSIRTAPPGVAVARQRLLAELAELPAGEWITLAHLTERLRLRAYEFLLPRRWTPNSFYYSGYYGYGGSPLPNPYNGGNELGLTFDVAGEEAGWDLVEAGFISTIILEALNALGAVDLGEDDGTITAFRVTADGARLLRGETPPAQRSEPRVIVQPNFQIFVMEPTGEDVLFRLDQMADRLRADQAFEYELTRDSVYRAQRAGLEADAIVGFLESVSTVGLPQNVRRTIEEWGSQHERITLRPRTPLLHALDEATLDGLYADSGLASLLGRRVAPTVALVPRGSLQPLVEHLLRRKLLPALSEGPGDDSAPLLTADATGLLSFRQRLPSIFDLRPLRAFADEAEGAMRLSPESLRRGARAGVSADEIVATLERLHAGLLPPEVTALVRKWARDWGQGALIEAALLQVGQPETLADLLADPDVRPLLQVVPNAPTLALVRADAVERVRAILNERGMALADRLMR